METGGLDILFLGRKLLKLVAVLYSIQKGMSREEIASQMEIERIAEKTDRVCKETRGEETAINVNSVISADESSYSMPTSSVAIFAAYSRQRNSISQMGL